MTCMIHCPHESIGCVQSNIVLFSVEWVMMMVYRCNCDELTSGVQWHWTSDLRGGAGMWGGRNLDGWQDRLGMKCRHWTNESLSSLDGNIGFNPLWSWIYFWKHEHFLSFIKIEMVQWVEIFSIARYGPGYPSLSVSWLIMSWRFKEPRASAAME